MAIGIELEQQNIIKELRDAAISAVDQRAKVLNKLLTVRDLLTNRWQGISSTSIAANSNTHTRALTVQNYHNDIRYGASPDKLVHYNFDSTLWTTDPPVFSQVPTLESMRVVIVDDTLSNVVDLSTDPADPLYFGNFYFTQNRETGELLSIDDDINAFITPNGAVPYHPKNNINGNAFDGTAPNPSASSDVRTDYAINRSRNVIQSVYSATFVLEIKLTNVVNGVPEINDLISIERSNYVISKVSEYDSTLQEATIEIARFGSISELKPQQPVISQTTTWTAAISFFGTAGRWALSTSQPFIFSTNISNYWLEKYSALPIGSFTPPSSDGFQAAALTYHNLASGTLHPGSGEINELVDSSNVDVPELGKTFPMKNWDTNEVQYFALCSTAGLEQQPGWNSNTASLTTTTYYDNDEPLKLSYDNWVSTLGYGNASSILVGNDPFSVDSIVRGSDPSVRSGGPTDGTADTLNNINDALPKWNNPLFPFIGMNTYDNDGEPYMRDESFTIANDMVAANYSISALSRWNYSILAEPFTSDAEHDDLGLFSDFSVVVGAVNLFTGGSYTYTPPPAPGPKAIHANTAVNLTTSYSAGLTNFIITATTSYDHSNGSSMNSQDHDFEFKAYLDSADVTTRAIAWLNNFESPPDGYTPEDTSVTRADLSGLLSSINTYWSGIVQPAPQTGGTVTISAVAGLTGITDLTTVATVYNSHRSQIVTELEQIGTQLHAIAADASDDILGIYKELRREITKEDDIYEYIRKQRRRYARFN